MKNDHDVLQIYIDFIIWTLPKLDEIREKEKNLLAKKSFFNKGRITDTLMWCYNQYKRTVEIDWEKIYSNPMHSDETQGHWELLGKNESLYAKTPVQKYVEQFYYNLSAGMSAITSAYNKKESEQERETYKTLFDGVFILIVEKLMNEIFPFAIEVLNSSTVKSNDKEAFIEENIKHKIDVNQSLSFKEKSTPISRELVFANNLGIKEESISSNGQGAFVMIDKKESTSGINSTLINPFFSDENISQSSVTEEEMGKKTFASKITGEISTEEMREYGKAYLLLLDEDTRTEGCQRIEKLVVKIPEAGVTLGQYYQQFDKNKAKRYFKLAADAGIAEGKWGYACLLDHSYIPDINNPEDAEWEQYCLEAADAECREAAHEMGNICHRRGAVVEAAYWYELSYSLGYDDALENIKGIVHEWVLRGKSETFVAGSKAFTKERLDASIIFLKNFSGEIQLEEAKLSFDDAPERMLGYYIGRQYIATKNDEMTYDTYSRNVITNYPYAMDKFGKYLMLGKGGLKNYDGGVSYIVKAAKQGCIPAMFSMGSFAVIEKDYMTAAYWYAQCYARGDIKSLQKLKELVGKR